MIEQSTTNKIYCIRCSKSLTDIEVSEYGFICRECKKEHSTFKAETSQNLQPKKFMIDGKELNFIRYENDWVFPVVTTYANGIGSPIAILLYTENNGELEYYADLTINIPEAERKAGCQFIDTNTFDMNILYWLEINGLGKRTGRKVNLGFTNYPEFNFYCGEKFREYKQVCQSLGY